MAKLFVVQDRYNEEITEWHIFSNAAKAQKKFNELDDEREEDWQLESLSVSGPNCGFCIGFDDDMGEVFAEPVKDVSKYDGIGGFGRRNSTAYLFGPKSKEGKVMVGSYGELEYTGNLDVVAEWEESELMESNKSLKHIKLFEQFVNEKEYEGIYDPFPLYEKKYSSSERKKLEKEGKAMPGGRFPIADLSDLRNAIHYIGKRSINGAKEVAKFIAKRMKELDGFKYEDMFNGSLSRSGLGKAQDYLKLA